MCTSGMINSRAFSGRVRPQGSGDEDDQILICNKGLEARDCRKTWNIIVLGDGRFREGYVHRCEDYTGRQRGQTRYISYRFLDTPRSFFCWLSLYSHLYVIFKSLPLFKCIYLCQYGSVHGIYQNLISWLLLNANKPVLYCHCTFACSFRFDLAPIQTVVLFSPSGTTTTMRSLQCTIHSI